MWWKLIGGWVFSCFGDSKKEGTRKVPPLGRHRALETRGAVVPFLRRRYVVSRWKGELFADGGADGVSPSSPTCLDALWRILIWTGRRGGERSLRRPRLAFAADFLRLWKGNEEIPSCRRGREFLGTRGETVGEIGEEKRKWKTGLERCGDGASDR